MMGRSCPQSRGRVQSTAIEVISLVMLIAAGVSNAYAQAESATAAWIQVGKGAGPARASVRAASASGATVTIEIPGIQTELVDINGVQYTKLTIPGAVSTGFGVGKAEVPAVPVLLARPTGSAVTFRVLSIQTETLQVARVFPTQPPLKLGEQAGPVVVDNSFYSSDVEYPSSRLSSPSLATWRDLDVVNVHVYPVTVRPAQHQVIVTSRIKFRVDFSGGSYPRRVTSWMVPMYRRLVQNYDNLRFAPLAEEPSDTKCLVFCYQDYVNSTALQGLLDTMTILGDRTEVINVPYDVPAVPEDIKSAIIDRYDPNQIPQALRWVFLVGNYDQIPPRTGYIHDSLCISNSDYWYSDLSQESLGCDNYPEVGIARLSPASDSDLSNQIAKIKDYMLGRDTGWVNRMTFVSAPNHPSEVVRHAVHENAFGHFFNYTIDTIMGGADPQPHNSDIRDTVERGTGVLIYLGDGGYNGWLGWAPDQSWTTDWVVDSLENRHTPVVFNLGCNIGNVDLGTTLSQTWMSKFDSDSSRGAVASFASYWNASTAPTDTQCILAVKAIADTAPVLDLGGIQMLMDAVIATNWPDIDGWNNIYGFYWLGSPAMQIWSGGIPKSADVTYPSQTSTAGGSFTVSVGFNDSISSHVEGAQVCAYKPGDFYVVGTTGSGGSVTLELPASRPGPFFVSASKGHASLSIPDAVHTPMLPYFGAAYACGNGPEMTYPNWGRKLVREPNTNTLHVVYSGSDTVFYTQSSNGGMSWVDSVAVGVGTSPVIVLNGEGFNPWIAYLTPDSSIFRTIRDALGVWNMAPVFQSHDDARAGAPSMASSAIAASSPDPLAYVTYPVYDGSDNYICFNVFSADSVFQPTDTLDAAGTTPCYGASVAVTALDLIHVAWIRDQSVIYRQRDTLSVWSPPYQISSPSVWPVTEPASHPSLEAYGDYVHCVWRGPYDESNLTGEIWQRSRRLPESVSVWHTPLNQSESPLVESDFPVMTMSFATVWHEQVAKESTDIWGKFVWDLGSEPFFSSPLPSRYPHVDGYWVPGRYEFVCNTVWTESLEQPPWHKVEFGTHHYIPTLGKGFGPGPHDDYEPALFYAADLGRSEQSPYCLSRGGFAQFESWNADTSATGLTYQLPYLDPRRVYKLCAVIYHEGKKSWSANVRCDSGAWTLVKSEPGVPETLWLKVPRKLYKRDARIILELARVTGDYVSLAKLKLFQIEEEIGGTEGVQSLGSDWRLVTRLRGCTPNPFARVTSVNYELARYGPVELTVHDVSGRLVRRLESGPRQRGFHAARWNGTDGCGRVVPAGVYFVRFSAGGTASTGRLTLVR